MELKKRISIYVDEGASHSFIWLIELFEIYGLFDIKFVKSEDIRSGILGKTDVLIISGGDSFAVAGSLEEAAALAIKSFIENGGTYVGICAGAYLMLRSSKSPLHYFNMTSGKIANLSSRLPEAKALEYKYSTPYGCSYIFHPVRGEISVTLCEFGLFQKEGVIKAPVYGGPFIKNDGSIIPLSFFRDFTESTLFLVDNEIAASICRGSIVSGYKTLGKGILFFFSTHMEHPDYPEANELFIRLITGDPLISRMLLRGKDKTSLKNETPYRPSNNSSYKKFRKNLSLMRLVAAGLEKIPHFWKIGEKVWETEKIRFFTESILKMEKKYGKMLSLSIAEKNAEELDSLSSICLSLLKNIYDSLSHGKSSQQEAAFFINNIKDLYTIYCSCCFRYINENGTFTTKYNNHFNPTA
ncbi:MAG: hypothetical protein HZA77_15860 [Candidatus Schekmanbacteria bacterium]|nr:hypothetical protein [Candidatus Schekmanbacteria bacterium]